MGPQRELSGTVAVLHVCGGLEDACGLRPPTLARGRTAEPDLRLDASLRSRTTPSVAVDARSRGSRVAVDNGVVTML